MNKDFLNYLLEKKDKIKIKHFGLEEGYETDFYGFTLIIPVEGTNHAIRLFYERGEDEGYFTIETSVFVTKGMKMHEVVNLSKEEIYLMKEELVLVLESLQVEKVFMSEKIDRIKSKKIEDVEQTDLCVFTNLEEKGSFLNKESQFLEALIRSKLDAPELLDYSFLNNPKILKKLFSIEEKELIKLFKSMPPSDWSEILELNYSA